MRPAMILAAGFGTRMGALTRTRPKPLIPVAGRTLIDHALAQLRAAGAGPIAVNGHYHADQMAAHLAAMADVRFIDEQPEILDSAGGVRNALPFLGTGPVVVLNADAIWTGANAAQQLLDAWRPAEMDALLLLVPLDRAVGRAGGGDFSMDKSGRLRRDGAGMVYTGAQIIKPEALEGFPPGPFSLNAVWDRLATRGRLSGTVHQGRWADVGHPAGIALAEEMLRQDDAV